MEEEIRKFIQFAKVEEGSGDSPHMVWGIATSEAVDKDGEICDYPTAKVEFQKWADECLARTTGNGQAPSLGNIRIMHGLEIGGKVVKMQFDDVSKQVWIGTEPASEEIFRQIAGGFFTGYSIGGKVLFRRADGPHQRYGASIAETSYVDNPCNPDAGFSYVKTDGSQEIRKFHKSAPVTDALVLKTIPLAEYEALVAKAAAAPVEININPLSVGDSAIIVRCISEHLQKGHKAAPQLLPVTAEQLIRAGRGEDPGLTPEQKASFAEFASWIKTSKDPAEESALPLTKRVAGEELTADCFAHVGDAADVSTWRFPIKFASEQKTRRYIRMALKHWPPPDGTKSVPEADRSRVHARIVEAAHRYGVNVQGESEKAFFADIIKTSVTFTAIEQARGARKEMFDIADLSIMVSNLNRLQISWEYEALYEDDADDLALASRLSDTVDALIQILKDLVSQETDELTAGRSETTIGDVITMANGNADLTKAAKGLSVHFKKMAAHHEAMSKTMKKSAAAHNKMAEAMGKTEATDIQKAAAHKSVADVDMEAAGHHEAMAEHCTGMVKAFDAMDGTEKVAGAEGEVVDVVAEVTKLFAAIPKAITAEEMTALVEKAVDAKLATQMEPIVKGLTLVPRAGEKVPAAANTALSDNDAGL